MKIITLDDMEERARAFRKWFIGHEHTHVYTAKDAIEKMKNERFDLVMLDHDLAEEHYLIQSEGLSETWQPGMTKYSPGTGMDVVDFMVKKESPMAKTVIVHSYNPVRAPEMFRKLDDAGFIVHRLPFGRNPIGD